MPTNRQWQDRKEMREKHYWNANEVAALREINAELLAALREIVRIEEGPGETNRPHMIAARRVIAKARES